MSFGGAVSAMITSLKNNKRDRVSAFDKMKKNKVKSKLKLHFDKKATPDQLKQIREKVRKENRKRATKNALLFLVILAIFIYVIGFVKI